MNPEIEALYNQAERAEKAKDFEKALQCYHEIRRLDPREAHAYYGAANAYAVRGLVPQVVEQYVSLGEVLESKKEFDGAIEVCRWVISIDVTNTQARAKLISLLEKQGRQAEAIQHSFALARIFSNQGQGEQAVQLLQRLQDLDPRNIDLTLQLGEVYIKQGNIIDGLAIYKKLADQLTQRQDYARAVDVRKRIRTIKLNDLDNLTALGHLYLKLNKLEESKAEFRQILRQDLNHPEALIQLGLLAKMEGQWGEARVPFRKMVELQPENAFAQESFAEVSEVLNHREEAIEHYLKAGELYKNAHEIEKAIDVYQNVLALDSDNGTARAQLKVLKAPAVAKKRFIPAVSEISVEPALESKLSQAEETAQESEAFEEEKPKEKQGKILVSGSVRSGPKPKSLQPHGKFNTFIKKKQIPAAAGSEKSLIHPKAQKPTVTRLKGSIVSHEEMPVPLAEPPEAVTPAIYVDASEYAFPSPEATSFAAAESAMTEQAAHYEPAEVRREEFIQAEKGEPEFVSAEEQEPIFSSAALEGALKSEPVIEEVPLTEIPAPAKFVFAPEVEAFTMAEAEAVPVPVPVPVASVPVPVMKEALEPQPDLVDVHQLVAQGKIGPAIQWCREALKEFPGKLALKAALGRIYFEHGFLEEALPLLKDVVPGGNDLELMQALAETYLLLDQKEAWLETQVDVAKLRLTRGQIPEAINAIIQVLGQAPDQPEARKILIQLLQSQGLGAFAVYHYRLLVEHLEKSNDLQSLIPVYQELLKTLPDNMAIRYRLAVCCQALGLVKEAKQEFVAIYHQLASQEDHARKADVLERVLALEPEDQAMMIELRNVYRQLGREDARLELELKLGDTAMKGGHLESAASFYEAILQVKPNEEPVMARMVELTIKQGKLKEAIDLGQRLAELYMESSKTENAILLYKSLLQADPDNVILHRGIASVYAKSGADSEAIAEYMALGHLASRRALFDEAIQAYRQVLTLDGSFKDARYQLGIIYADHKHNWEMAAAEFKKVRTLDPRHEAALSRLVEGYAAHSEIEIAVNYIRDLIHLDAAHASLVEDLTRTTESQVSKDPENPKLHFNLGILYRERGSFDEAIREFQLVIRKFPQVALRAYAFQGLCWEGKGADENDEALYQTALKIYRKGLQLKGFKEEEYLELKYLLARLVESFGKIADALALYQEIVLVDMEYKDARDRKKQLEEELSSSKVTRLPSTRRQESAP